MDLIEGEIYPTKHDKQVKILYKRKLDHPNNPFPVIAICLETELLLYYSVGGRVKMTDAWDHIWDLFWVTHE